jgi:drug/metabolite transporter (DMT)-like permease
MEDKTLWKGVVWVAIGAISYGVLATMVKLAYLEGYSTESVTFSQFGVGTLVLGLLVLLRRKSKENLSGSSIDSKAVLRLLIVGTTTGMTGLFYYRAVHFIPVSLCIVLLMQSVWMGVILDAVLLRIMPARRKIIAMLLVLIGTVIATEMYVDLNKLEGEGLFWGILAAVAYTVSIFANNRVALHLANTVRSFFMILGGWIFLIVMLVIQAKSFPDLSVFWPWGILLALFGTVLPPLFLNKGMPLTGVGLGSIIVSLEIPVSVTMAFLFLGERFSIYQWVGVVLIMAAIVFLNYRLIAGRIKA